MNKQEGYDQLISQGIHYAAEGKLTEAQQAFEQAKEENPERYEVYTNLGALAQLAGDHPRALGLFEQALQLNANHVNTLYNKGISLAALKKYGDALQAYDRVLVLDPSYTRVFMAKAYALMQLGADKQAKQLFESFLQIAGPEEQDLKDQVLFWMKALKATDTEDVHFDLLQSAKEAMDAGDGESALRFLNKYLDIYPVDHLVLVQRAYVLAQLDQREEAAKDSQMAEKLAPEEAWIYFYQAKIEKVYGRNEAALVLLGRAEQLNPELPEVYTFQAELTEDPDLRFQLYSRAITQNPTQSKPYFERGRIFQERGDMLEALSDFSRALRIEPERTELYQKIEDILGYLGDQIDTHSGDASMYAQRAQAFMRLERFEDSISDWQAALKISPANPLLIRGISTSLVHSGQATRAWELITQHLEREEPLAELLVDRARISMMLMQNEAAENDLIEALSLDAALSEAHYLKGKIHLAREEGLEAETHFMQALQLGLELPDLYHHLGLREIEKGNLSLSLEFLEKGIELGINPDILMDAAHVSEAMDERKKGLKYLETLLLHFPNEVEAWKLQAHLQTKAGEKEKALNSYQAISQIAPLELEAWQRSMELAYELGKWEISLNAASRLFSSDADDLETLRIRALSYFHLGKKVVARRDFQKYLLEAFVLEEDSILASDFSALMREGGKLSEEEIRIWEELREVALPQPKKKKPWWKLRG